MAQIVPVECDGTTEEGATRLARLGTEVETGGRGAAHAALKVRGGGH